MFKRKMTGHYYEWIRYDNIDDRPDKKRYHNPIPFSYELKVRTNKKEDNNGIFKTTKGYILNTSDELPFKQGDKVVLTLQGEFTIKEVRSVLKQGYEHLATLSPHMEMRYQEKELVL